jgi:predicted ArsR family transcriptional regulator
LASPIRVAILRFVRAAPEGVTAAEVAEGVGRRLSTVREHLDQLTAAGLLRRDRVPTGVPGRPAWRYRAGVDPAVGPYREMAMALAEYLAATADDPWRAGIAAGRGWGRRLAAGLDAGSPGERVVTVVNQLGFDPTVTRRQGAEPVEIHLRNCPFRDLVDASADVICGIHLGIIRGAVGTSGGAAPTVTLTPFGASTACIVRLTPPTDPVGDPVAMRGGAQE